ncbi:MAG: aminotransferase class I/II-fold pyridoxal phosphate-dependent enzyme, partial [Anaerolineae bacterium]
EKGYLPGLEEIPGDALTRAKVMWLNYPANPTTAVAGLPFLAQMVEFAREHDILVAYDNPYADVTWDGLVAPSIMEVSGAREVALEFNSFSKVYNMAGWRVGMAVGGAQAIAAMARLKTNVDSGIFRPIQDAAIAALETDSEWIAERNRVYKERRQVVTQALERMGIRYAPSSATLYVWARIPGGRTSAEFCVDLLELTGVSVSPGSAFGPHGEGYVRVTLGQTVERMEEAMTRWEQWMSG